MTLSTLLHILLIDDDRAQYDLIHDFLTFGLRRPFQLDWMPTYEAETAPPLPDHYDIFLVDLNLGQQSGLDIIAAETARGQNKPMILLTGQGSRSIDEQAMKAGAADYLDKGDLKPATLERAIRYALDRSRTLRDLRESEERYRDLFENSSDLIQSVAEDGRFIYVNSAWCSALEYTQEEAAQLRFDEIIHPSIRDECLEIHQRVLAGEAFQNKEVIFISRSGREIYVEGSLNRRLLPNQPASTRGIFRDVTARRRSQAALQESEERLRMIVTSAPVFLFTLNPAGIVTFFQGKDAHGPYLDASLDNLVLGIPAEKVIDTFFSDPLKGQVKTHLALALQGAQGSFESEVADRAYDVKYNPLNNHRGEFQGVIGFVIEVTDRKRAAQSEREQRMLAEGLRDAAAALTSTLNVDEILDLILVNVEKLVEHDSSNIMLLEEGVATIVRAKGYSAEMREAVAGLRLPLADIPNLRTMYETQMPLIIPDISTYAGWVHLDEVSREQIRSFAGVPIIADERVIGFLCLDSRTANQFNEKTLAVLQVFSGQVAVAIENARLYQNARELAALNERQRLARDLHDAVSQTLFSASVIAETLPRLWEDNPDDVREGLTELHFLTRRALAEMRSLLLELRPSALVETPIKELFRQLVEIFSSKERIPIEFEVFVQSPLLPEVQIVFYRVAQEGLNNIGKHARAKQVYLSLYEQDGVFQLRIQDDGRGFDPNRLPGNHFGVQIMSERAASIGAELTITSEIGKGTEISLVYPAERS